MLDGLVLAGFHVEAGARTFADYSRAMLADLGDGIRPLLRHFYNSVRDYPGFDATGGPSYRTCMDRAVPPPRPLRSGWPCNASTMPGWCPWPRWRVRTLLPLRRG